MNSDVIGDVVDRALAELVINATGTSDSPEQVSAGWEPLLPAYVVVEVKPDESIRIVAAPHVEASINTEEEEAKGRGRTAKRDADGEDGERGRSKGRSATRRRSEGAAFGRSITPRSLSPASPRGNTTKVTQPAAATLGGSSSQRIKPKTYAEMYNLRRSQELPSHLNALLNNGSDRQHYEGQQSQRSRGDQGAMSNSESTVDLVTLPTPDLDDMSAAMRTPPAVSLSDEAMQVVDAQAAHIQDELSAAAAVEDQDLARREHSLDVALQRAGHRLSQLPTPVAGGGAASAQGGQGGTSVSGSAARAMAGSLARVNSEAVEQQLRELNSPLEAARRINAEEAAAVGASVAATAGASQAAHSSSQFALEGSGHGGPSPEVSDELPIKLFMPSPDVHLQHAMAHTTATGVNGGDARYNASAVVTGGQQGAGRILQPQDPPPPPASEHGADHVPSKPLLLLLLDPTGGGISSPRLSTSDLPDSPSQLMLDAARARADQEELQHEQRVAVAARKMIEAEEAAAAGAIATAAGEPPAPISTVMARAGGSAGEEAFATFGSRVGADPGAARAGGSVQSGVTQGGMSSGGSVMGDSGGDVFVAARAERSRHIADQLHRLQEESRRLQEQSKRLQERAMEMQMEVGIAPRGLPPAGLASVPGGIAFGAQAQVQAHAHQQPLMAPPAVLAPVPGVGGQGIVNPTETAKPMKSTKGKPLHKSQKAVAAAPAATQRAGALVPLPVPAVQPVVRQQTEGSPPPQAPPVPADLASPVPSTTPPRAAINWGTPGQQRKGMKPSPLAPAHLAASSPPQPRGQRRSGGSGGGGSGGGAAPGLLGRQNSSSSTIEPLLPRWSDQVASPLGSPQLRRHNSPLKFQPSPQRSMQGGSGPAGSAGGSAGGVGGADGTVVQQPAARDGPAPAPLVHYRPPPVLNRGSPLRNGAAPGHPHHTAALAKLPSLKATEAESAHGAALMQQPHTQHQPLPPPEVPPHRPRKFLPEMHLPPVLAAPTQGKALSWGVNQTGHVQSGQQQGMPYGASAPGYGYAAAAGVMSTGMYGDGQAGMGGNSPAAAVAGYRKNIARSGRKANGREQNISAAPSMAQPPPGLMAPSGITMGPYGPLPLGPQGGMMAPLMGLPTQGYGAWGMPGGMAMMAMNGGMAGMDGGSSVRERPLPQKPVGGAANGSHKHVRHRGGPALHGGPAPPPMIPGAAGHETLTYAASPQYPVYGGMMGMAPLGMAPMLSHAPPMGMVGAHQSSPRGGAFGGGKGDASMAVAGWGAGGLPLGVPSGHGWGSQGRGVQPGMMGAGMLGMPRYADQVGVGQAEHYRQMESHVLSRINQQVDRGLVRDRRRSAGVEDVAGEDGTRPPFRLF